MATKSTLTRRHRFAATAALIIVSAPIVLGFVAHLMQAAPYFGS